MMATKTNEKPMVRRYEVEIEGFTYLSQSRRIPDRPEGKSADEYDQETWRDKLHVKDGFVQIPGMALKQMLDATAQADGGTRPGAKGKTWGALFTGGVMVLDDCTLNAKAEDVEVRSFWCDPQGKKGDRATSRVQRRFPMVPPGWRGRFTIMVTDPNIEAGVLERYTRLAGYRTGVGRFRPSKGGNNGMFNVLSFKEVAA